ncbi:MAG: hypothetical protein AAGI08_04000 [Bacteroidota bacterium]
MRISAFFLLALTAGPSVFAQESYPRFTADVTPIVGTDRVEIVTEFSVIERNGLTQTRSSLENSSTSGPGIDVRVRMVLSDHLSLFAGYTYFDPSLDVNGYDLTVHQVTVGGQLGIFPVWHRFQPYLEIAAAPYLRQRFDGPETSRRDTRRRTTLQLGAGFRLRVFDSVAFVASIQGLIGAGNDCVPGIPEAYRCDTTGPEDYFNRLRNNLYTRDDAGIRYGAGLSVGL